jgi:hypothetical protein
MTNPLEKALAFAFIVIGLSHVLHGQRWAAFFEPIFANPGGPFWIGLLTLPIGLLIVAAHNVWAWELRVLVTLYGWASIVKATLYFLIPQVPLRIAPPRIRQPRHFAVAGAVLVALGLLIAIA